MDISAGFFDNRHPLLFFGPTILIASDVSVSDIANIHGEFCDIVFNYNIANIFMGSTDDDDRILVTVDQSRGSSKAFFHRAAEQISKCADLELLHAHRTA